MTLEEVKNQYPDFLEEDLKNLIDECKYFLRRSTFNRIKSLNKTVSDVEGILEEWNKIQSKESFLSNSERKELATLVGMCIMNLINKENERI